MKANSGWVDDVYIFLFGMCFFSPKVGISPSSLLFFKNDKTLYGEVDKVAAGTDAARALASNGRCVVLSRKKYQEDFYFFGSNKK